MNNPIKSMFNSASATVKEINEKYKEPRIKMTPATKFALVSLRVYLLLLILLMIYKFLSLVK